VEEITEAEIEIVTDDVMAADVWDQLSHEERVHVFLYDAEKYKKEIRVWLKSRAHKWFIYEAK
jgi:hypothetical protein